MSKPAPKALIFKCARTVEETSPRGPVLRVTVVAHPLDTTKGEVSFLLHDYAEREAFKDGTLVRLVLEPIEAVPTDGDALK